MEATTAATITAMLELRYAAEPGAAFVPAGAVGKLVFAEAAVALVIPVILDIVVGDTLVPFVTVGTVLSPPEVIPGVTFEVARAARAIKSVRFLATVGLMAPTIPF